MDNFAVQSHREFFLNVLQYNHIPCPLQQALGISEGWQSSRAGSKIK